MRLQLEARGGELGEMATATVELKDATAGVAMEVVVVGLAGELKSGRLAGDFDLRDDAGVREDLERAVDGGEAQAAA